METIKNVLVTLSPAGYALSEWSREMAHLRAFQCAWSGLTAMNHPDQVTQPIRKASELGETEAISRQISLSRTAD